MATKTNNNSKNTVKYYNIFEAMSILSAVYYKHSTSDNPNPDYSSEPNYSFMTDLYVYYNDTDKMDKYIKQMLNTYCVHDFMSYMELLDTISYTAYLVNLALYAEQKEDSLFQIIKDDDKLLATLEKWYNKMMYNKSFYKKYCTDDEIKKVCERLNVRTQSYLIDNFKKQL